MADKPKSPKPFLGEEDLAHELEAWDSMFDQLHEEPAAGALSSEPVMEWPEAQPSAPPLPRVPDPVLAHPDATLDDFAPAAAAVIEIEPLAPSDTWHDGRETDFSEVGAEGAPEALSTVLGSEQRFDDEPPTSIIEPRPRAQSVAEEDIYTSASRPNVKPAPEALPLPDDPIAPPPQPVAVRRTGPAIIRRTPLAVPVQHAKSTTTPMRGPDDDSDPFGGFGESTKVAQIEEIEAKLDEVRRADARSKAPTAPPSFGMSAPAPADAEEDFPEIEVDASQAPEPQVPVAPAGTRARTLDQPGRRTVAHVVRRETPARGAPIVPSRESGPIAVPRVTSAAIPIAAPAEDDFSDVAAAVGAGDMVADPPAPLRRASTGRGETDVEPDPEPVALSLDRIDEIMPELVIEEEPSPASSDVYVPMAPAATDFDLASQSDNSLALQTVASTPTSVRSFAIEEAPPTLPEPGERPPALMDLYPRVKTPTSVPPIGMREEDIAGTPRTPRPRLATPQPVFDDEIRDVEPAIDLDAIGADKPWPEQVQPMPTSELDEELARMLLVYEREISTVDDSAQSAALRIEAGRLCERLGDTERARSHYDAALLADPRATSALRGLRRIARASSDLVEATKMLDAEIAVAGALERRPLGHYRIDLLLASGDQDLARVAVGEVLDSARSDVRALLAQLELAFLDGRADEFGSALEQLTHAVADNELRAAVQTARGMLAAHHQDAAGAMQWFSAAAESDPGSLAARLGAIRHSAAQGDGHAVAHALLDLARQVETTDPMTAATLAMRAQHWATGEPAVAAAQLATATMPGDPLIARVAAETTLAAGDAATAAAACALWAATPAPPHERAYAAARAAELDPARAAELWNLVLEQDHGDDYAAAQLRTAYVAGEAAQLAIEVDLAVAQDVERDRARLRAAFGLIGQGQLDAAIDLLQQAHTARPKAIALSEALAEALAAAGRWTERAQLLAKLAAEPGDQLDREVAHLRSALALEEAVGAAAEAGEPIETIQRLTTSALGAWERVLDATPSSPSAHAASLVLATRLGDREVIGEVLARAQAAERSPWAAATLGLRRARLLAADDPSRAEGLLREVRPELDDPRRTVGLVLTAARTKELADAATALEDRAKHVGDSEAAALRLRAAQLALDAGDAQRASALLVQVSRALPGLGIISDLLAAARRRSGDRSGPHMRIDPNAPHATADAFARLVRDADLSAQQGEGAAALALYQRALELRPADPLAATPLVRAATQLREPAPIAALALAQLRASETSGDGAAKAEAYELLAHLDKELRGDAGSAQIALENASQADPTRIDLMHRLEREYAASDQVAELMRLRRSEVEQIPLDLARDRAAMIMDAASLAERDNRPDVELVEMFRQALAHDPKHRLALLQLESIVRRGGASPELAQLEEQIATYFEGEPRSQAAFFTRAGETLAELGQIDAAVQKFGRADEVLPGHVPALEGWRAAALKGQLWLDVATAATRQAAVADDADTRASLHHFAGVVLMDKALIADQATTAFRRALDAAPAHKDAFLRLRILLDEDGNHDELAILLGNRLEHETEAAAKIELHRALAELHRNFLDARDIAKQHYREILTADPNDLRAHAAVADIAWEQGNWQEAADALISRAKLERDPAVLKTLCFRLGLIYADRLVDVPMALKAFQRALTYQPDDEGTLVRLADLATQAGEWKLALGACERLVKSEQDPDKRATHLHRVAKIFREGFGDMKRAERALNLALDNAPTNDDALSQLVTFYRDAGDMTSVRVHLNRVAGAMRVRVQNDPKDAIAYRVIARSMSARASAGVDGSLAIARAGAELATLLGGAGEPERLLLAEPVRIDLSALSRTEADDVLFPRGIAGELRQLFTLLGDRVAKHVGVDLRAYGVGRGDRLRAKDGGAAAHAQDVATGLGFGEIDVYVSTRQPHTMVAEPTSPVSLVIGQAIAQGDSRGVRFAAGAALKLAQASLAIPARLPQDELGVLVIALLRLFQSDFHNSGLDDATIATQMQKLRRLIPNSLMNELKPFGLAIDGARFGHDLLARDLKIAGLRAGLVAAGSVVAGLNVLAAAAETDVPSFLANPVAQGLLSFALSEDHATLAR